MENIPDSSLSIVQKKICLLGEFAVGKTSLVRRYVDGRFDDRYLSTIGVKISRRQLVRPYGKLNLLLWDLAGSDEFNGQISTNYLRGASGAFIVCDLTRRETLSGFKRYVDQMESIGLKIPLIFVGNKVDLLDERAISNDELQDITQKFQAECYLSSAKTGENVETIFERLATLIEAKG